ncbi:GxxExxY protein [Pollutibacter soli]|uniref:GxxExxY protein n=1 Tax=Pollutibacter soli TaxID=3034157 RepID=UPI003AF6A92A
MGPGLLEKVYESCFCYELKKRNISFRRQLTIPVIYDEMELEDALRMDVFVDKLIICELKAMDQINPVWQAQVLSHLRLSKRHIGFLLNFNAPF